MVRRIIIGLIAAVLALVVTLFSVVYIYLNTDHGRNLVLGRLNQVLSDQLGASVAFEEAGGQWPHHIVLDNIVLTDADGPWAHARRLEIRNRETGAMGCVLTP